MAVLHPKNPTGKRKFSRISPIVSNGVLVGGRFRYANQHQNPSNSGRVNIKCKSTIFGENPTIHADRLVKISIHITYNKNIMNSSTL